MTRSFVNSGIPDLASGLATNPARSPVLYTRADFTLFHAVETLTQKLGCTRDHLRRVVIKEIADNALDAGGSGSTVGQVTVEEINPDAVRVSDDGPGLPGTDAEIAALFSTERPLVSSKLLRLPTRGALGNGLRAVAGAVYASRGSLTVTTHGRRLSLTPEADGTTSFTSAPCGETTGTTVEITFGAALPRDDDMLLLAEGAINNRGGESYAGRSSPHWYDADAWHGLLQAAPDDLTVRAFLANLEGCSGAKAGTIAQDFKGRSCASLSRDEATRLLIRARDTARPVKPDRLGCIGPYADSDCGGYAKVTGVLKAGGHEPFAEIPFVIEAWAMMLPSVRQDSVRVLVNRTPIVSDVRCRREPKSLAIFGAGLSHAFDLPGKTGFAIEIAVTTPFMPLTSDGKAPDLLRFESALVEAIEKAAKRARRMIPGAPLGERDTQKAAVLDALDEAIDLVSSGGTLRYNPRQLYYPIRPKVAAAGLGGLTDKYFDTIISDYENEIGQDLPGISRDPRGTYILPHTGETVPLGTRAVEEYVRPPWLYGSILYIEKEGFAPILQDARWGERHDCMITSSKGQTTRAVKDLLDKHKDSEEETSGEPIQVFCVHDADAYGTEIYRALVEETRARGARQVEVINIGLEPWEAVALGLEVETFERGDKRRPVADYVREYDDEEGEDWEGWLQTHRIELNALTSAAFITWLDAKVAPYAEKVVPPPDVVRDELEDVMEQTMREAVIDHILREADVDNQVAAALAAIERPTAVSLHQDLRTWLAAHRDRSWRERIADLAAALTKA